MPVINYLTTIQFDYGAIAMLGDELARLGVKKPLIVTDKGVVAAGLLERVGDAMPKDMARALFDETPSNPTERASVAAAAMFRKEGCDGIVAVGGGSALDLAKAAGLLATHEGPLARYAMVEGGVARIRNVMPPLIAIPTTAGTGSEVGRGAIIVLEDGRKLGLVSPFLIPTLAICDPELTLGLPPMLTAGTGMDAFTHCVECYISKVENPPAGAIALDGLERCAGHILRATRDGKDREARWQMMMAAMEGAMAFQKGLGAVHAISHVLGGLDQRLHHGTLNAVLLPHVLRFNEPEVGEKYPRLARAIGVEPGEDVAAWIEDLNGKLGLPSGLRAMGVDEALIEKAAPLAPLDHTSATNPRKASADDYLAIMRAALD